MKWRLLVAVVSWSLLATSCYTAGVNSPVARAGHEHSDTGVVWFWGISDADLYAEECQAGLAQVVTGFPWYTYVVAPLTFGIITPVSRKYYCAER